MPASGPPPPPPALVAPVRGGVARPFRYAGSPFARGLHRGADLRARAGDAVRAPCAGVVAHAGPTPGGPVVTLRCGRWRVSVLPVAPAVRVRARLPAGARVGTLATLAAGAGHRGLHLGVRRAGDAFGYVDPAPLLHDPPGLEPPVAPVPRGGRRVPAGPPPAAVRAPVPATRPVPAPRAVAAHVPDGSPGVPWPAWAGVAAIAAAALAGGVRRARAATVSLAWASTSRRRSST